MSKNAVGKKAENGASKRAKENVRAVVVASDEGSAEFWDLVEMFDTALRARRRSPRTRQSYREALTLFVKFLEERGMPTR